MNVFCLEEQLFLSGDVPGSLMSPEDPLPAVLLGGLWHWQLVRREPGGRGDQVERRPMPWSSLSPRILSLLVWVWAVKKHLKQQHFSLLVKGTIPSSPFLLQCVTGSKHFMYSHILGFPV